MNKKIMNRQTARTSAEKAEIRAEENRRIHFAAMSHAREVLKSLHTTLCGLDGEEVSTSRLKYGTNKVTHEKKKPLALDWLAPLSIPLLPFCFFWQRYLLSQI